MDNATKSMIRATRRVRNKTTLGRLENLQRELRNWKRRATFARNKVDALHGQVLALAQRLAEEKFNSELPPS